MQTEPTKNRRGTFTYVLYMKISMGMMPVHPVSPNF